MLLLFITFKSTFVCYYSGAYMNGGGGPREDLSGYLHRAFDNARETGFFSSKRVKIQHFGFRGSVFGSFLVTLPKFMNVHLWGRRNGSKKNLIL